MQAAAIMKGTKNPDDAKKFMDWSISGEAMEIYAATASVVAMPGVTKGDDPWREHFPPSVGEKMIDNDFVWAAANKSRIIGEWRKRFDAKSEPK